MKSLWERARKVSLQGAEAWALCPEDLLLHLCLHTCMSHGLDNGIMALLDISHVISHYEKELDWEQLMRRAGTWGADKCVYLVVHLAERLLGVSIPEHIRRGMEAYRDSAQAALLAEELLLVESTPIATNVARLFSSDRLLDKPPVWHPAGFSIKGNDGVHVSAGRPSIPAVCAVFFSHRRDIEKTCENRMAFVAA